MSWLKDMERDAVAITFPDWEWRDDDVVIVDQQWTNAGGYSEYTNWDASFATRVDVRRADHTHDQGCEAATCRGSSYSDDEAAQFWAALMEKGSARD